MMCQTSFLLCFSENQYNKKKDNVADIKLDVLIKIDCITSLYEKMEYKL